MRNQALQILFLSLAATALTGCDLLDQVMEGNVSLQLGNIVIWGPGAKKPAGDHQKVLLSTMGKAIPSEASPSVPQAPTNGKSNWGTCDATATEVVSGAFQKVEAEVSELRIKSSGLNEMTSIKFPKRTVNMLRLASEISSLLTTANIPNGEYREVVVLLDKATLTDKSGNALPLALAEGGHNQIRIVLERTIVIEQPSDAQKISLSFCTEGNFLMSGSDGKKSQAAFYPIIDRVANLSI